MPLLMVVVAQSNVDDMIGHALESRDAEVCGILGGRDGRVERVYRARNVAETPRTRFNYDPRDWQRIDEDIADAGMTIVGFYHSHVHTQASPSPTDVAEWNPLYFPDAVCFICSIMEPDRPDLRAYRIDSAGKVTAEPLEVE